MATAHVLVIDDIPDLLKRMRILLESEGYSVDAATNGEEGLRMARAKTPDVVCLDLTMPKMSGFEVLETMRGDAVLAPVPVLMISARSTPEARMHASEGGANGFLVKPFKQRELFDEVKRLLGGK